MVILDTDTLSHLMSGTPSVVDRLLQFTRGDVCVPQPVLAEIEYGITRLGNNKKARALRARLVRLTNELSRVEWTDTVSESFGRIKSQLEKSRKLIEDFDIAIAAHAVAMNAPLISGNTQHMKRVRGLKVDSWME